MTIYNSLHRGKTVLENRKANSMQTTAAVFKNNNSSTTWKKN